MSKKDLYYICFVIGLLVGICITVLFGVNIIKDYKDANDKNLKTIKTLNEDNELLRENNDNMLEEITDLEVEISNMNDLLESDDKMYVNVDDKTTLKINIKNIN